jgi:hypothetical protein
MTFNQAAVNAVFNALRSIAMETGVFRTVNTHEPKSAPGTGKRLSMWVQTMEPLGLASGLAAASGYLTVQARIYGNMLVKPEDEIDPDMTTAMTVLMGAYCGDFDLGGLIRNIDLFGMYGQKMAAQAGYLTLDSHMYRIMTLTIPCVVNDMWTEVD